LYELYSLNPHFNSIDAVGPYIVVKNIFDNINGCSINVNAQTGTLLGIVQSIFLSSTFKRLMIHLYMFSNFVEIFANLIHITLYLYIISDSVDITY